MKKLGLFFMLALVALSLHAQDTQNLPLNLRSLSLDDKVWFREIGFPITKYNFDNYEINQELSLGLGEREKAKTLNTISWGAYGVGILTTIIGAISANKSSGKTIVIGGMMMVGGLTVNLFSISKRKKAQKRIRSATYLYDDLN